MARLAIDDEGSESLGVLSASKQCGRTTGLLLCSTAYLIGFSVTSNVPKVF